MDTVIKTSAKGIISMFNRAMADNCSNLEKEITDHIQEAFTAPHEQEQRVTFSYLLQLK